VLARRRRERRAVEQLAHQVDPPARRVHLLAPQRVCRAGGQAEPAVHAVLDHRTEAFLRPARRMSRQSVARYVVTHSTSLTERQGTGRAPTGARGRTGPSRPA
jgi:hypothetical protein